MAGKAKEETEIANELERIQLAVLETYTENRGNVTENDLKKTLEKENFVITDNLVTKDSNYLFKTNGKIYRISKNGNVVLLFDENTFQIGQAKNIENYGELVEYESENGSENWRLFYQDSNYAYLIYDGTYPDIATDDSAYKNGSYVSNIGKKLSSKIDKLFVSSNTKANIRKTAYLLDTEFWGKSKKIEDTKGIALFAIGSPTIELFVASYNNASEVAKEKNYHINLSSDDIGYKFIETSAYFSEQDRNGIYNLTGNSQWWLASPYNVQYHNFRIIESGGYWTLGDVTGSINPDVRPIVCINVIDLKLKN